MSRRSVYLGTSKQKLIKILGLEQSDVPAGNGHPGFLKPLIALCAPNILHVSSTIHVAYSGEDNVPKVSYSPYFKTDSKHPTEFLYEELSRFIELAS